MLADLVPGTLLERNAKKMEFHLKLHAIVVNVSSQVMEFEAAQLPCGYGKFTSSRSASLGDILQIPGNHISGNH